MEVVIEVRPGPLAAGLVGRALGAVAARCELPLDRLDDALLAVDVVCDDGLREAPATPVRVRVAGLDGEVWLHVGPLPTGRVEGLLGVPALPGGPPLLEALADAANVALDSNGDILALSFAART
jgi:hypothetical protein